MQKINIVFIAGAIVLGAMFACVSDAQAGCVTGSWTNIAGNGTQAKLSVTNSNGCGATQVSLCSYQMYIRPNNSGWLSTQTLFDSQVITLQPGQSATMVVDTDNCMNQVDAYTGPCVNPFTSDNTSVPNIFIGRFTEYIDTMCSKCTNECSTSGQRTCDGNGFKQCAKGSDGCFHWTHSDCQANQTCSNGTCIASCTNDCNVKDQHVCDGNGYKQCNMGSDGCYHWSGVTNCGSQTCSNGSCITIQTCTNDCSVSGQHVCDGNGYKQCNMGSDGCYHWSGVTNCAFNESCNNGSCASSCQDVCTFGDNKCTGSTFNVCGKYDNSGCTTWKEIQSCDSRCFTCGDGKCECSETHSSCSQDCAANAPTVDLHSNGSVTCDKNATLIWTTTNAISCTASGGWSGSKLTSGSESVGDFTGERTFTLTCTNGSASAFDSVILNGSNDNLNVSAGSDKNVDSDGSVRLDGSVDGNYDSLSWTCTGGSLSDYNTLKPTFRAPFNNDSDNYNYSYDRAYTCTLTARNECGSDSDSVTINVNRGNKPVQVLPVVVSGSVSIVKTVSDLSNGTTYQGSVTANPLDFVSYRIIVGGVNGTSNNIIVRDAMPAGVADIRDLRIDGMASNGNIESGIDIGSLCTGQTRIITFTGTVANESNFIYGQTTVNNVATVTANGTSATSNAIVYVYRRAVMGATTVSTGFGSDLLLGLGISLAGLILCLGWVTRKRIVAFFQNDPKKALREKIAFIKENGLAQ